jgi:hypothetical protein
MSKVQLPKVEALVKVFKDNNWKPRPVSGALSDCFVTGRCCAVPAVVKILDPNEDGSSWVNSDDTHKSPYGNLYRAGMTEDEVRGLYNGFDDNTFMDGCMDRDWYDLGKQLRVALDM